MAAHPDITVAAITETDGRFLVVEERINRRLVFNQPAGHVERGESLLAAVVREVREETAWRFEPQALLGVYLWRNPAARPRDPALRLHRHGARPRCRPAARSWHRAHALAVAAGARCEREPRCAARWSCAASRTTWAAAPQRAGSGQRRDARDRRHGRPDRAAVGPSAPAGALALEFPACRASLLSAPLPAPASSSASPAASTPRSPRCC